MDKINLSLLPLLLLATPSPIPPIHIYTALTSDADHHNHHHHPNAPWWHSKYADIFLLCLGMQTPLVATALNEGEFPACAAMTTGYVFRVENAATVMFLRRVGRSGCLVTLRVSSDRECGSGQERPRTNEGDDREEILLKTLPVAAIVGVLAWSLILPGLALLVTMAMLILSRALALLSIRLRCTFASASASSPRAWHGAPEPGVQGDLLILLSEDRWVRIQGAVDDLKAATSGSWLPQRRAERPGLEINVVDALDWSSRMLVYLAVVALSNARDVEKVVLLCTVLLGHLGLAWRNSRTEKLIMNGRTVCFVEDGHGRPSVKKYSRRLEMAEELVQEMGRDDFAIRLGLINPKQKAETEKGSKPEEEEQTGIETEVVTM